MKAAVMTDDATKKLLKLRDVCVTYSISRTAVYRLMSAGRFPKSVDSGAGPRWRACDLEKWASGLKVN